MKFQVAVFGKPNLSCTSRLMIQSQSGKKRLKTVLSPIILDSLLIYFKAFKPFYRLFERQKGGKYFERSIQHIIRNALLTSGDNPWGTVSILGHSFATNLSLGSINLRIIQNFLGHSNSKITEIYTRITTKEFDKIVNQIDKLNLK